MKTAITKIIGKLSLLLVSIVFTLILAEVLVRVSFPTGNEPGTPAGQLGICFWVHDDILGYRQLPNVNSGWKGVSVITNSKGIRDNEYTYERQPQKNRILVLGDSYVWGWGVKRQEIFTKLIESQKENLEVISMGVPGYSTDQELLWFKDEGLKYSPDILLLLIEGGDFYGDVSYMCGGRFKPMFSIENDKLILTHVPVPDDPVIRKIHYFFRSHSYFYIFLYKRNITELAKSLYEKITDKPLSSGRASKVESTKKSSESVKENIKNKYIVTLKILKEIHSICKENNIKLILAAHHMVPEQLEVLDGLAKEDDFPFINLIPSLANFKKANPDTKIRLGNADDHWDPLGHKIIADAIIDYMDKHQLWPSPNQSPNTV